MVDVAITGRQLLRLRNISKGGDWAKAGTWYSDVMALQMVGLVTVTTSKPKLPLPLGTVAITDAGTAYLEAHPGYAP